jgi:hypothetical protein
MAQGGRVVCARCGANNFDTVSACWKCSSPLSMAPASAGYGSAPNATPNPQPYNPMPAASATEQFGYRAAAAVHQMGDIAKSNRAAFWLGITMPYFGFPIGLAFMMCDDPRRQEVGRLCIIWSLISGVLHTMLMFVSLLGMREWVMMFMGGLKAGLNSRGGGMGGGSMGGDGL